MNIATLTQLPTDKLDAWIEATTRQFCERYTADMSYAETVEFEEDIRKFLTEHAEKNIT